MDGDYPAPWASGIHNVWLQITAEIVTGRRFVDHESAIILKVPKPYPGYATREYPWMTPM